MTATFRLGLQNQQMALRVLGQFQESLLIHLREKHEAGLQ